MPAMPDYSEGIKKEVVEIKFLIHDLRVERFINEVIHFHVTLNTDLELSGVDQAQVLHGHDLQVLKEKAVSLRKAFQDYSNAVRNFSPDRTVLLAGRHYVNTIYSVCELILSPLWGRVDKVLTFLPPDSRSTRARTHYLNCIHFIRGVHLPHPAVPRRAGQQGRLPGIRHRRRDRRVHARRRLRLRHGARQRPRADRARIGSTRPSSAAISRASGACSSTW